MKQTFTLLLTAMALALSLASPTRAADPVLLIAPAPQQNIVILYTNDVHTYIDNTSDDSGMPAIRYSTVAALKNSYERDDVLLVDAGDHIQGTAYGSMDKGKTILSLMNAAGYDLATLGNHEFDYGMTGAMAAMEWAEFDYVSANFHHETDGVAGQPVLAPYKVFEAGGKKVAFVGITTPESFTKSTPAYFQNEQGQYIYGIAGGEDGTALYTAVQKAIDSARAEADIVIALGHLGDDPASRPWTSEDVIAHTTGLDAFIDGHSHSVVPMKRVADKQGKSVVLTQTGEYLNAVGEMTIAADGTITTRLLTAGDMPDTTVTAVQAMEEAWITQIDTQLGQVIGQTSFVFDNYDGEGKRLVRSQETNTGAFAADALKYLFANMGLDVDVAIMNGGGVRNKAITGEISYQTLKEIHTFGNVACLQTVTGQQLLDALEWGAKSVGESENGGFLHVSGLQYTIDTSIPSTVQADDKGVWAGGPTGAYRVKDVQVYNSKTGAMEPLQLDASYNLAGYNYTLRDLGDGFAMFEGAVNVLDYVMEDYMVLANYVQSFPLDAATGLHQVVARELPALSSGPVDYTSVTGTGRINILSQPAEPAASATYVVMAGDTLWKIAKHLYGSGTRWADIYGANSATLSNPNLIYIGQTLVIPAP